MGIDYSLVPGALFDEHVFDDGYPDRALEYEVSKGKCHFGAPVDGYIPNCEDCRSFSSDKEAQLLCLMNPQCKGVVSG